MEVHRANFVFSEEILVSSTKEQILVFKTQRSNVAPKAGFFSGMTLYHCFVGD